MAANATVSQLPQTRNSLTPRHGVIILYGYGIVVQVDRGHLIVKDGIGKDRYYGRLPRIGHGLRRLVVVGSDGFVSFAALRWLADQKAAFVMLERDGTALAATGPVGPSDARLRRAQALASQTPIAVNIGRELIRQKLLGQEQIARERLNNENVGNTIATVRGNLPEAKTIEAIRIFEARAALAYWSAWRTVQLTFPKTDLARIPDHWRNLGTRTSPLTGSPRCQSVECRSQLLVRCSFTC